LLLEGLKKEDFERACEGSGGVKMMFEAQIKKEKMSEFVDPSADSQVKK
jgi:hypothetical protein